jgi:hypothetical protein
MENVMTNLKELLNNVDHDKVAKGMAALLTDPDVQTYDMFENIVIDYTNGSEDFRKGMDKMFEILTWSNLEAFVTMVRESCIKEVEE